MLLPSLRRGRAATVVIECRHCGTTVDSSQQACPTCGAAGFARYEIGG